MLRLKMLILTFLLLLAPTASPDTPITIAVIVHPSNPTPQLSRSQLRPIFQTKQTSWKHGGKILALNLRNTHPVRKEVDVAVLGWNPDRVFQFWIDRKIRGGAPPPKTIPSSALMLRVVANKKNAIGYVAATEVDRSVKVIAKIRNGKVQ